MLFNSLQFLYFFVVVTVLYYTLKHQYRWMLLLAASCYFYMAFIPIYICILGFTIVIDYFAGILIENTEGHKRKAFLVCSIIANVGVLAVFKYYNFLNGNLNFLLHGFALSSPLPYLKILLPIGLSFHTFQAMSYTIEVYRRNYRAERHFGMYSLYVMFYPQLVAGPIERPQNLLPQLKANHVFDYNNITSGLRLIAWGLFKKVVIADRVGILVDHVYSRPHDFNGISLIIATFFFALEDYCDFSGYSDIAIGTARIMGIKLMQNFNYPIFSKSISDFWSRWHISLTAWFRQYVYKPMMKKNKSVTWHMFTVLFVLFLVGLWHGPNWTFIAWGILNALYLIIATATRKPWRVFLAAIGLGKHETFSILGTFSLLCFSVIFFRADTISNAFYVAGHIFTFIPDLFHFHHLQYMGMKNSELLFSFLLILFLVATEFMQIRYSLFNKFLKQPVYIRWAFYYIALFVIGIYGIFEHREFIYFQF
jgi:alginate O-acetyltransferase complex protein AlgI